MNGYSNQEPFYERIWFIVLMFIVAWPAGALLLILRLMRNREINMPVSDLGQTGARNPQKKIAGRRNCRARKIWGIVLIVFGACVLLGMDTSSKADVLWSIITGAGFTLGGGILLLLAKGQLNRWDAYEACINNRGNTYLSVLAEKTGKPEMTVRVDVQRMINNGFFRDFENDIDAYIDGECEAIVMTRHGMPIEPVKKQPNKPQSNGSKPAAPGSYVEMIHEEIKKSDDTEFVSELCEIESSVRRIEAKLKEDPSLEEITAIRQLKKSYLPKTMEMIRKFNEGTASQQTLWEIKAMLRTCAEAFGNIEKKLYERDDIDTKVDMEVLKKTFEREGLLDSDFDIKH